QSGEWYAVRVMPYRTQENVIQGAVITFVDITAAKLLEARLRGGDSAPSAPANRPSGPPPPA
ncbi:PAS domain-containing protein, partial [Klebsiella pneumoniae]|nr:PAS domain-containing protein [Klebsiella pneumoniae]